MDNKSDDKLIRELGHETGGKTPRWMVPVVGVLLIGGALAAAYFLSPDRAGEAAVPEKLRKSIEAKKNLPSDPKELQSLMVGKDIEKAKLAVVKLAISGSEGWPLLFGQVSKAAPEVRAELQQYRMAEGIFWSAADVVESGPPDSRDGALVVLQGAGPAIKPDTLPPRIFQAVMTLSPASDEESAAVYSVMDRYHPVELDPFFEALKSESPSVRDSAVTAIRAEPSVTAVTTARVQGNSPDAKDVAAVKAAISRSLAAARKPAPTR